MIDIIRTLDDIEWPWDARQVECPFCGRTELTDETYPAARVLKEGCSRCALAEVESWFKEQRDEGVENRGRSHRSE